MGSLFSGADDQEHDGVYSAYFVNFTVNSRTEIRGIRVSIQVENFQGSAYVRKTKTGGVFDPSTLDESEFRLGR